jgi:hypothetical protein
VRLDHAAQLGPGHDLLHRGKEQIAPGRAAILLVLGVLIGGQREGLLPHAPINAYGVPCGADLISVALLRQYLPKGTDLSVYSQDELDAIADSLNTRPRKTLDWNTPIQVFSRMLADQAAQPSLH